MIQSQHPGQMSKRFCRGALKEREAAARPLECDKSYLGIEILRNL
jgi:hypothetical protein